MARELHVFPISTFPLLESQGCAFLPIFVCLLLFLCMCGFSGSDLSFHACIADTWLRVLHNFIWFPLQTPKDLIWQLSLIQLYFQDPTLLLSIDLWLYLLYRVSGLQRNQWHFALSSGAHGPNERVALVVDKVMQDISAYCGLGIYSRGRWIYILFASCPVITAGQDCRGQPFLRALPCWSLEWLYFP